MYLEFPVHTHEDQYRKYHRKSIQKQGVRFYLAPNVQYQADEAPDCRYHHCRYPRTNANYNGFAFRYIDATVQVLTIGHSEVLTEE